MSEDSDSKTEKNQQTKVAEFFDACTISSDAMGITLERKNLTEEQFVSYFKDTPKMKLGPYLAGAFKDSEAFVPKKGTSATATYSEAELSELYTHLFKKPVREFPSIEPERKGGQSKFLMSPPTALPTFKGLSGKINHLYHWEMLKRTVQASGGEVIIANSVDTSARGIFTRDPVVILEDSKTFLIPTIPNSFPQHIRNQVKAELDRLVPQLEKMGYTGTKVDGWFQGGDVIYDTQAKVMFVGTDSPPTEGDKKSLKALTETMKAAKVDVIAIPRESRELYHLDLGMARLPCGKYLVCKELTTAKGFEKIQIAIGKENVIEVDKATALGMATNMIHVGNTLIMPHCPEALEKTLNSLDYKVVTPHKLGLSQNAWNFEGGSVHCSTLEVARLFLQPENNNAMMAYLLPKPDVVRSIGENLRALVSTSPEDSVSYNRPGRGPLPGRDDVGIA